MGSWAIIATKLFNTKLLPCYTLTYKNFAISGHKNTSFRRQQAASDFLLDTCSVSTDESLELQVPNWTWNLA